VLSDSHGTDYGLPRIVAPLNNPTWSRKKAMNDILRERSRNRPEVLESEPDDSEDEYEDSSKDSSSDGLSDDDNQQPSTSQRKQKKAKKSRGSRKSKKSKVSTESGYTPGPFPDGALVRCTQKLQELVDVCQEVAEEFNKPVNKVYTSIGCYNMLTLTTRNPNLYNMYSRWYSVHHPCQSGGESLTEPY
jgi:hypothetical protein